VIGRRLLAIRPGPLGRSACRDRVELLEAQRPAAREDSIAHRETVRINRARDLCAPRARFPVCSAARLASASDCETVPDDPRVRVNAQHFPRVFGRATRDHFLWYINSVPR